MSFSENLYNKLMILVKESNNAFYYKDSVIDSRKYRIFNYRLASFTDFIKDGALECRGHMFDITDPSNVTLSSLPMEKFFNLNENPMTQDLDLANVISIYEKADGSLISTYIHNGQLKLKSKGSITSVHCIEAMKWLDSNKNEKLKKDLEIIAKNDMTVNLEWCSPEQRIVIAYEKPMLKILNIRCHKTGLYIDESIMTEEMKKYLVSEIKLEKCLIPDFIKEIPNMSDNIEGFVILFENKQRVKLKTNKYYNEHQLLGSLKNPRNIYELIIDEQIDDICAKYYDDPIITKMIDDIQIIVKNVYNNVEDSIEKFVDAERSLVRKDFYKKAKENFDELYLNIVMRRYSGETIDLKQFMKSKYKYICCDFDKEFNDASNDASNDADEN
jgi:T4 RnlA family RNA ligase